MALTLQVYKALNGMAHFKQHSVVFSKSVKELRVHLRMVTLAI